MLTITLRNTIQRMNCSLFAPLLLPLLVGCGGIVYKERAGLFVEAGRAVTTAFDEAASAKGLALERHKQLLISHDKTCPIGGIPTMVRNEERITAPTMQPYFDLTNINPQKDDCSELSRCLTQPTQPSCQSVCFSAAEANCLIQVESAINKARIALPEGTKGHPLQKASREIDAILRMTEYGRARTTPQKIAEASLEILTDYLDTLEAHVDLDPPEVAARAKALEEKIKARIDEFEAITGKEVPANTTATADKAIAYLGAIGALGSTIRDIYRVNGDATKIKSIVRDNKNKISNAMADVKDFLLAERQLATNIQSLDNIKVRNHLGEVFKSEPSQFRRFELLEKLSAYPVTNDKAGIKAIEKLFKKLDETHSSLITLIENPTDADKRALYQKAVREFIDVVSGVVKIIKLGN